MKSNREGRTSVELAWDPEEPKDPRKEVVGVILSDGTVYGVAGSRVEAPRRRWSSGRFSGAGWELWWERRTWDDPS